MSRSEEDGEECAGGCVVEAEAHIYLPIYPQRGKFYFAMVYFAMDKVAPLSWAIAPSVVCAEFRPRRKSSSL